MADRNTARPGETHRQKHTGREGHSERDGDRERMSGRWRMGETQRVARERGWTERGGRGGQGAAERDSWVLEAERGQSGGEDSD